MTLSPSDLDANVSTAFRLILEWIGEAFIRNAPINPADSRFADILPTTWKRMEREGFLVGTNVPVYYFLSSDGFAEAILGLKESQVEDYRTKLGKLAAALKDSVKGREGEATVSALKIAEAIDSPIGWVQNAIVARMLERCFQSQGAQLHDNDGHIIAVPLDFGHNL